VRHRRGATDYHGRCGRVDSCRLPRGRASPKCCGRARLRSAGNTRRGLATTTSCVAVRKVSRRGPTPPIYERGALPPRAGGIRMKDLRTASTEVEARPSGRTSRGGRTLEPSIHGPGGRSARLRAGHRNNGMRRRRSKGSALEAAVARCLYQRCPACNEATDFGHKPPPEAPLSRKVDQEHHVVKGVGAFRSPFRVPPRSRRILQALQRGTPGCAGRDGVAPRRDTDLPCLSHGTVPHSSPAKCFHLGEAIVSGLPAPRASAQCSSTDPLMQPAQPLALLSREDVVLPCDCHGVRISPGVRRHPPCTTGVPNLVRA